MGNNSSCSLKKEYDELSEYDIAVYNLKKEKIYWGTIAICIIYAIFALILFLSGFFSEKARFILINRYLPFTIVYIIGTFIIVMFLLYQIFNFEPIKIDRNNNFDQLSCPDYWKLSKSEDGHVRCKPNKKNAEYASPYGFYTYQLPTKMNKYEYAIKNKITWDGITNDQTLINNYKDEAPKSILCLGQTVNKIFNNGQINEIKNHDKYNCLVGYWYSANYIFNNN